MTGKKYLLDTNICIYYLRGKYNIDLAIDNVGWSNCYISEITLFELKIGIEISKARDGIDRSEKLNRFISSMKTLPIASSIDYAAKEKVRLRAAGTPVNDNFDLLIGCTAVVNEMVMVTENLKDFKDIQRIELENWIFR